MAWNIPSCFNCLMVLLIHVLWSGTAFAEQVTVAVAANFTGPAKVLKESFQAMSGHQVVLAFGSTGKLYTQIANGAPFEIFLAADQARPLRAEADHLAVMGSRFTYALGKVVLYSFDAKRVDEAGAVLNKPETFAKIAIANPKTAPYGGAAREVMEHLGVWENLKGKLVTGDNIAQTFQFVVTQNAALGFVAASQITPETPGSVWHIPDELYSPIRQDAVLLSKGQNNPAARAFLTYLQSPQARDIIASFGYGIDR